MVDDPRPPEPYRPPPIGGRSPSEGPGLSLRAVAAGVAVDWIGTFVASLAILLVATAIGASRYGDEAGVERYLEQLRSAPDFVILSSFVGLAFVSLGGYVAGRVARCDEVRHAAVMGSISLALGIAMDLTSTSEVSGWYPTWLRVMGHVLVLPAALFGGFLARGRDAETP